MLGLPAAGLLATFVAGCSAYAGGDVQSLSLTEMEAAAASAPPVTPFGADDDRIRSSLRDGVITKVERGRGGRSVAFKITLEDGTVGYFKPEQTFAAHWYSEVASYYIDRALGLGRVPPAVGRRLPWSELRDAAKGHRHLDEVVIADDGTLRGSFVWWVPVKLVPLSPPRGWEAWLTIEPPLAVSPFRWGPHYKKALARSGSKASDRKSAETPSAPSRPDRPGELSDLILFDYLIGNHDRWGGDFTNVRTLGPDGPLVFMDNANGFHAGRKQSRHDRAKLAAVQRVRGSTIEALRRFDVDALRTALAEDPLAPVLKERHFRDLEQRRAEVLEHVQRLQEEFGDEAVPW
jgi:hypothetical protein